MMKHAPIIGITVICLLEAVIAAVPICTTKRADVYFIVDSSDAVWRPDFARQLAFVRDVIDKFHLGAERTRVGVIALSDRARLAVPLVGRAGRRQLKRAVLAVRHDGGAGQRRSLADAFRFLRERCLPAADARSNVTKMAIVLTSGSWRRDDKALAMEARLAREGGGLQVFVVGIGAQAQTAELAMAASQPTSYYSFPVAKFADLKDIRVLLAAKACRVMSGSPSGSVAGEQAAPDGAPRTPYILQKPTTPNIIAQKPSEQNYAGARFGTLESYARGGARVVVGPDPRGGVGVRSNNVLREYGDDGTHDDRRRQLTTAVSARKERGRKTKGCVPKVPLDIVFVVVARSGGRAKTRHLWKFVRRTLSGINTAEGRVTARFLHQDMRLANSTASSPASAADLLRAMALRLRESSNATSGSGSWPIGVFVTDGPSGDLEATLREAQAARLDDGVELFAVAAGGEVSMTEMRGIPSCPLEKHLLTADSHTQLGRLTHRLTKRLCFGKRRR